MGAVGFIKENAVDGFVMIAGIASAACGQWDSSNAIVGPVLTSAGIAASSPLSVLRHPGTWRTGPARSLPANQHFVDNGHDGTENPLTNQYLYRRSLKSAGSATAGMLGGLSQAPAHGVDAISATMHTSAAVTTSVHLYMLKQVSDKYKSSKSVSDWLDVIRRMKQLKLAARGVSLAAAVIPFTPAQTIGGILGAIINAGVKLTVADACQICAMEIHWRAFQEQAISGGRGGAVGPASQIAWELFNRRSYTRILGTYDVAGLVKEPAGFMAIGDKITAL